MQTRVSPEFCVSRVDVGDALYRADLALPVSLMLRLVSASKASRYSLGELVQLLLHHGLKRMERDAWGRP